MDTKTLNNQDKILYQIKRLGPLSVKSLAERLDITTMGVRQHLTQLEQALLVRTGEPVPQKRGRPVVQWHLTEQGHARFPDAHAQVTLDLIANVRDVLGEVALDKVIEARAEQTRDQYKHALRDCHSLEEKILRLVELRSAEGYMAEMETVSEGLYLLIEQHCPICIAATSCQGFCRTELVCFQEMLADLATVTRDEYLLTGARRCTYIIQACK